MLQKVKLKSISLLYAELLFTNFTAALEGELHYGYTILESGVAVVAFFDKCALIMAAFV